MTCYCIYNFVIVIHLCRHDEVEMGRHAELFHLKSSLARFLQFLCHLCEALVLILEQSPGCDVPGMGQLGNVRLRKI